MGLKNENSNFNQLLFRQAKLLNLSTPINDFIGVTIAVILLWFGGKEVLQNNNISSDGFIRYIMFLFAMLQPSRRLGTGIATIQTGIASANRVKSVLDIEGLTWAIDEKTGIIRIHSKDVLSDQISYEETRLQSLNQQFQILQSHLLLTSLYQYEFENQI